MFIESKCGVVYRWKYGPIISIVNDSSFFVQLLNHFVSFTECKILTQLFAQTTEIFPLWIQKETCFLIHGKVCLMAKVDCSLKHHEFIVSVGRIYSMTIHGKSKFITFHYLCETVYVNYLLWYKTTQHNKTPGVSRCKKLDFLHYWMERCENVIAYQIVTIRYLIPFQQLYTRDWRLNVYLFHMKLCLLFMQGKWLVFCEFRVYTKLRNV